MRSKLSMATVMIIGSFVIYCGQQAMNISGVDGGPPMSDGFVKDAFVRDANAQSSGACCTQGYSFAKLSEGDLGPGGMSGPITVGNYREAIIYLRPISTACPVYVSFRPDSNSPFAFTGTYDVSVGARLPVNGSDLRVEFATSGACAITSTHYMVAGVQ